MMSKRINTVASSGDSKNKIDAAVTSGVIEGSKLKDKTKVAGKISIAVRASP